MSENLGASYWEGIPQKELKPDHRRCIDLLCKAFALGPWNILTNWENLELGKYHVSFVVEPATGALCTFDGSTLTRLVFLAHDNCIRVSVAPRTFRRLKITMHFKRGRTGGTAEIHPTLEDAVGGWRKIWDENGESKNDIS